MMRHIPSVSILILPTGGVILIQSMEPSTVQRELQAELDRGERLLWSGTPVQGFRLQWIDAFLIPFILVWMAAPAAAVFSSLRAGRNSASLLFLLPFLAIGIYMLVGRYIVDARRRAQTVYGVTTRRILIVMAGPIRRMTTLSLTSLSDLTVTERRGGGGTIQFGQDRWPGSAWAGGSWPGMSQYLAPRFDLPANVRHVYNLIRKAESGDA